MYEVEREILFSLFEDTANNNDLQWFIRQLQECECIVAGGCITSIFTNQKINDIDIYFRSAEQFFNFFYNDTVEKNFIYISKKAITFTIRGIYAIHTDREKELRKFQAVACGYYNNAEEIFNDYDFTINMGAYDFKEDKFVLHENFMLHNAQHKIDVNVNTKFPIVSAIRINKYKDRGYYINHTSFYKLAFAIKNLNITSWDEFSEQLGGAYGEEVSVSLPNEPYSDESALDIISELRIVQSNPVDVGVLNSMSRDAKLCKASEICGYKKKYYKISNNILCDFYINKEYDILSISAGCRLDDSYTELIEDSTQFFPMKIFKVVDYIDGKYMFNNDGTHEFDSVEIIQGNRYCRHFKTTYNSIKGEIPDISDIRNKAIVVLTIDSKDDIGVMSSSDRTISFRGFTFDSVYHNFVTDGIIPVSPCYFDMEIA